MCKDIIYKTNKNGYHNADEVMKRGVLLPVHHGMSDDMFNRLHKTINKFLEDNC